MSPVEKIHLHWPLRKMCERFGIDLPEGGKFESPFRVDNNPSCEEFQQTIRDRTTGESYDSIRVFAEKMVLSNSDAINLLYEEICSSELIVPPPAPRIPPAPRPPLELPAMTRTKEDCAALANLRKLPVAAVEMATIMCQTVGFGWCASQFCWFVADGDGHICEARRMDGLLFPPFGKLAERKAHTLRGSNKGWPVNLKTRQPAPDDIPVVLGEGGPDYLALCALAVETKFKFLPVVMLGSGSPIDAAALPMFRGRAVTVLAHPDEAGRTAAIKWARQLDPLAASVRVKQLIGGDVNDLVSAGETAALVQEVL